ncbi:MAG: hypothetical protein RMI89_05585 [Gloeomargarita sp. SKYBB_i_bin120]|nr:class I SAM-dependent methyltransferase [Gloeomargarita sp. SKYG98]MCS7292436.1 class I SAM-dependent methyltransferase [Gloeomargarita sp. SKYB120]MDW8177997.1 hypothetical protein [Gloeomargarita sp. SKYBB_i_bin120]
MEFWVGDSKLLLPALLNHITSQGEPLAFVLIDGDHSTEAVKTDINLFLAHYRPIVPLYLLMHDTFYPPCRQGIL